MKESVLCYLVETVLLNAELWKFAMIWGRTMYHVVDVHALNEIDTSTEGVRSGECRSHTYQLLVRYHCVVSCGELSGPRGSLTEQRIAYQ